MTTVFIGIDPGKTGAIAYDTGAEIGIYDCPLVVSPSFKPTKKKPKPSIKYMDLDYVGLVSLMSRFAGQATAVIESVRSFNMGRQSAFVFGANQSAWITACAAYQIPIITVEPSRWKSDLGLLNQEKSASRLLAIDIFPMMAGQLKRAKDHDRAEALLMMHWLKTQKQEVAA